MSASSASFENDQAPMSDEAASIGDDRTAELSEFVREFIRTDNEIARLKQEVKPTTDRIRELSVKKRHLATVVATIMGDNDLDTLEPKLEGRSVGRLTRIFTKRVKPTVASFEKAVLTLLLDGNSERLKQVKKKALDMDKPPVPSLRRSKNK